MLMTSSVTLKVVSFAIVALAGAIVGTIARGSGGMGWLVALLVSSAILVAIAQQTLP